MRRTTFGLAVILTLLPAGLRATEVAPMPSSGETATVKLADGFEAPVGREGTKRYYMARGFRANGHLGEDWNGEGGGDTDLGDPVFCVAHGIVVFAQDYKLGWGNVVIVRHAYLDGGRVQYVDSLYGHLHQIFVAHGDRVTRGQKVGTIGNNRGQYDAHLHFEMRKNLNVGMFRSSFPRDASVYWVPSAFIAARPSLEGGGRTASVPINTFPAEAPPVLAGAREATPTVPFARAHTYTTPGDGLTTTRQSEASRRTTPIRRTHHFKVDRFGDMRESYSE